MRTVGFWIGLWLLGMLPYLWFGPGAHYRIVDHLDAYTNHYRQLAEHQQMWDYSPNARFQPLMNGLPRAWMVSGYRPEALLYTWFDAFRVTQIMQLGAQLFAFWGMWLWLSAFVVPGSPAWLRAAVACLFGLLPFFSCYGLSLAGLPLVAWALGQLGRGQKHAGVWMALVFYTVWSNLLVVGIFVLVVAGLYWLFICWQGRHLQVLLLLGLVLMTVLFALSELPLILAILRPSEVIEHHRQHFVADQKAQSLWHALDAMARKFVIGDFHTASLQLPIALLMAPLTGVALLLSGQSLRPWAWSLAILLALAALLGFYFSEPLLSIRRLHPLLNSFNFTRFHILSILIWYSLLAWCLFVWQRLPGWSRWVPLALSLQLGWILLNGVEPASSLVHHLKPEWASTAHKPLPRNVQAMNYQQFFAPELFAQVRDAIGKPQVEYRVLGLGLHSGVLLYNGFYCLSGYVDLYPYSYKQQFRAVMADELARSEKARQNFDGWGNRCELMPADLWNHAPEPLLMGKGSGGSTVFQHLQLNSAAMRSLGCVFLISAVQVPNPEANDLKFIRLFDHPSSGWRIWLYELKGR